ncbi:MAG: DNA mismatch repair protein MutS [Clostridiales bacterium]|nr:DNA mismatch repair protein MutS [Clostridiales bacterium]
MATAMMEQYLRLKEKYPDHILFFRLGDFYEMFYDDAKIASRELELTLTGRDCGEEERAPMCGIPYHACEPYIGRLISRGYKVAICEQVGDVTPGKGPMERRIVRVITPGTVFESTLLDEKQNNYLSTIYYNAASDRIGLCFCDISSATVSATSFPLEDESRLINELGTYMPSEIITNVDEKKLPRTFLFIEERISAAVTKNDSNRFNYAECRALCDKQFGVSQKALPEQDDEVTCAAGALLSYVAETQLTDISYIKELSVYSGSHFLEIDINTRRNLELTETMRSREKRGTLLWVLDRTKSAMGARLLRNWVEHPLVNTSRIVRRQAAIAELADDFMLREEISRLLSEVLDLERLITKVGFGTANGRDLRAIYKTLEVIPKLRLLLKDCKSDELHEIYEKLDELDDVRTLIRENIAEDPPISLRDGGIIADGANEDIDYLRGIMRDGKGWISEIEAKEREATGIKNLRIGYNKVFGYYIEVTKSFINQVPDRYIRKQTLVNCERYITEELKEREATILGAEEKLKTLEYELFCSVRSRVAEATSRIRNSAALIARTDVYCSLADVAKQYNYTRPEVDYSDVIEIKDGRHPVVERFVRDTYFVPNDTLLDTSYNRLMIITGPNMAGKSTYMRQVALIVVMAQIGSFVPAKEARIGIVDKLFTRVGASDDLASGQSTFMLEMSEVSYILANATRRSLIIYDEIGRGTSTYDGLAIARAVAEYTHSRKIGARTMFATHYHELTVLEDELEGAINYNIAAKKRGSDITFLRKIVRGGTDDSFGIEVAKLAGLPSEVIKRARAILDEIESHGTPERKTKAGENDVPALSGTMDMAMSLVTPTEREVTERIRAADPNTMTPIEAINFIYEIKKMLEQ